MNITDTHKNGFRVFPQQLVRTYSWWNLILGDWYPERNVFQILIAICSGPRFALIFLWYLLTYRRGTPMPKIVAAIGVLRTFLCGGWVYVTSTDDHGFHDITMIGYLLCTLPWTLGIISMSPLNPRALKYRKIIAGSFFGTLIPLIYYFIQHKVHRVAGGIYPHLVPASNIAYTTYAFFEWSLVLMDAGFDAVSVLDFDKFEIQVVEKGLKTNEGLAKSSPSYYSPV
jgi:Frag1/DRAM/Sfk1 family